MDIREKIKLKFDDDFFKEEIRCDYKVTEKLKKIWAVELDLLNELLVVCKKYDIRVIVYAGTLLGSVRHKGMIPWDDDIDVALTRNEYEKLLKVAPSEFKHPYFFQTALTDRRFFLGYARLRNSLTTGHVAWENSQNYNNGIFIDIFVLDGMPDDDLLLRKQIKKRKTIERLANIYNINCNNDTFAKKWLKLFSYPLLRMLISNFVSYEDIVEKYNKTLSIYTSDSTKLTILTHTYEFVKKYWCLKADFNNIQYVPFENLMVPIPENTDCILRNMYGDYMKYPPTEKRGAWHDGIIEYDPDIQYKEYLK